MRYQHFTQDERNELSILLNRGYLHREIAKALGKNRSSVSREISRNTVNEIYDPKKANTKAQVKRLESKYQGMKIVKVPKLADYLLQHLRDDHWTPEEVAGRWNAENHMNDSGKKIIVTAPSIYKYLYSSHGQSLCQYLISKRYKLRKRKGGNKSKKQLIPNKVSIELRPEAVNERTEFGHFEGDTLGRIKTDSDVICGILERMSRFIFIEKIQGLKYAMDGFNAMLNPYHNAVKSLTLDNGVENIKWEKLGLTTYFCHAYSSWEKGGIENLFGRLRRFIPKKASLKDYSEKDVIGFANILNNTPRKCLNWQTPKEVFEKQLALAKVEPDAKNITTNTSNNYPQQVQLTI